MLLWDPMALYNFLKGMTIYGYANSLWNDSEVSLTCQWLSKRTIMKNQSGDKDLRARIKEECT